MSKYDGMKDREIDCLIATGLMRRTIKKNTRSIREYDGERHDSWASSWQSLPYYSSDDNAARNVRDRIAELGLIVEWQHSLALICGPVANAAIWWMTVQATPRQQCIAALMALDLQTNTEGAL